MAAAFTDNKTRNALLDTIWRYASNNATASPGPLPLGLTYDVQHGTYIGGTMRLVCLPLILHKIGF